MVFIEKKDNEDSQQKYIRDMEKYFIDSVGDCFSKIDNFAKYASRQSITRFLAKYELFKKIVDVQGSIIECGVLFGGGLMTFAKLSTIFEPVNTQRKIIGFDTFSGFAKLSAEDKKGTSEFLCEGGLAVDSYNDLLRCVELYDNNRFLPHIPKVELVKGDAVETIPLYVSENQQLVVSMLYLDMDVYAPTKTAIEYFLPRIPKGGIIVFDELNSKNWPGETKAVIDTIGIAKLKIKRFSFDSYLSYAIIE